MKSTKKKNKRTRELIPRYSFSLIDFHFAVENKIKLKSVISTDEFGA